jgi:hypothetical protein
MTIFDKNTSTFLKYFYENLAVKIKGEEAFYY